MNLSAVSSIITLPGDASGHVANPLSTQVQLTVEVHFSDGSIQVMTTDPRTVFTVKSGSVTAGLYSSSAETPIGPLVVTVTFPSWQRAAGFSASVTLSIVKMVGLIYQ